MLITCLLLLGATQAASAVPKELSIEGAFREPLSSVEFPLTSGPWSRTRVLQYSSEPRRPDHSVGYQLRRGKELLAHATVFIFPNLYPVPDNPEVHLDEILSELSKVGRGYELVEKQSVTFTTKAGTSLKGFVGMFLFHGGVKESTREQLEQLFLLKHDSYWIEWRITSFENSTKELIDQVLDLIHTLLPEN